MLGDELGFRAKNAKGESRTQIRGVVCGMGIGLRIGLGKKSSRHDATAQKKRGKELTVNTQTIRRGLGKEFCFLLRTRFEGEIHQWNSIERLFLARAPILLR